ncbi:root phototropism protein 3-like isoform X2 [Mercurialis annua]|nr:root phototropism protein 3-like isoform X2 [Mercurialis annua]
MVSKSGYLNRLVFESGSYGEKTNVPKIQIDNFPGGADIFELVVKFCYGWKVDLTAANVAPVICAAHFLEMGEDFKRGNLISRTETFLSFMLLTSWKDIFQILKSCEAVSSWAKELHILKRCSEAIAWKASIDPKTFASRGDDTFQFTTQSNNAEKLQHGSVAENWWFEDVSFLRIDHFLEVIEYVKRKGVRSELVGSCIAHWTAKWISQIHFGKHNLPEHRTHRLLKVTAESLINVLPEETNSISCNFLLHLLKLGTMMRINVEQLNKLERRIACMLEQCSASDLLVKNYDKSTTLYDVKIVLKVVQSYLSLIWNPAPRLHVVGRLMDEYLTMISRDEKLSVEQFQLIADVLPKNSRVRDDNLYRAIDVYLKAHPSLTEDERTSVCRAMDYHKLSQEARGHAMKNQRLPSYVSMRISLLEQVKMAKPMTGSVSDYQRTISESIIRLSKGCLSVTQQNEIKMMKIEVMKMKMQLNALQMCKMQMQRQVKGCTF